MEKRKIMIDKEKIDARIKMGKDAVNLPCPRCGNPMNPRLTLNALSRYYDGLHVCSDCGMAEALEQHAGQMLIPLEDWTIFK